MAEQQQTPAQPGDAWAQAMENFANVTFGVVDQTMRWQQDLVRMWVDTGQQLASFWMPSQRQEDTGARGEPPM